MHPVFRGKTSIKNILPVLVPKLSYQALAIQEGGTASETWNKIVTGELDAEGIARERDNLLKYCGLDSLAMVGFAGAENALYILQHGPEVLLVRIATATPIHIFNAIVASRLLWLAVREQKPGYLFAALVSAIFLHGLYDYSILNDTVGDGKFLFALAMTASIAVGLMRRKEA